MKPTLLLSHGVGWSAHSPIIYTLQRLTKYCHNGFTKKLNYLYLVGGDTRACLTDSLITEIKYHVLNHQWENRNSHVGHKMNTTEDLSPLKDFPLEVFEDFCTPPYTIDKYITFYKTLWEIVEPQGYKAVSDWSPYVHTPALYNALTSNHLQDHFNLKGLIIVRDPIRRAFSHALSINARYKENNTIHNYLHCYIEELDRIRTINPDTQIFVMEELWENPNGREKKKLSDFLQCNVTDLWQNGYAPDLGHLIPEDPKDFISTKGTPCQYAGQRDAILTPELYREYRKQYSYIYDNWKRRFGILPRYWGRPINYESNVSL